VSPLVAILTVVLLGLVVLVVSAPLRAKRPAADDTNAGSSPAASGGDPASSLRLARDELEAQREAKYREIRDCELDYRTGKLSLGDYEAVDTQLRAEAIEILNALEALDAPALRPRGA
jgi:hypothetical protein